MAVVNYSTINGTIVYENRNGVEHDYMPDPLGSTVGLIDSSQNITDTFEYWPYGEVRTRAGTTATPFTFVGTLGYYFDLASALMYVRARYYFASLARWLTVDRLWPDQPAYAYVRCSPAAFADPGGLLTLGEFECCFKRAVVACIITRIVFSWPCVGCILACLALTAPLAQQICLDACVPVCGASLITAIGAGIVVLAECLINGDCAPPPVAGGPPVGSFGYCWQACAGIPNGHDHYCCLATCRAREFGGVPSPIPGCGGPSVINV